MSSRSLRASRLAAAGVVAVIRAPDPSVVPELGAALVAGGITALEITTSTPRFAEAIRATRAALGDQVLIGAGTLMEPAQCDEAISAGAEFAVSPVFRPALIPGCHAAGVPVLLGAFTPTEAQAVHESGADFVKLFPAEVLGLKFIKGLKAPLPHLRLVPTGGVDATNAGEFRRAGCVAVGVGGSLVKPDLLKARDWPALTALAAALVASWRS
jgi:2-dehydro-3-deoxyphosphogluconate aldolase/(4S)-4-hydroxy-2-oxoglutarate aldolase